MKEKLKSITQISIIAALYAALSVALAPFSFGMIQVRVAGALVVLPIYNRKYTASLVLGCAITNLFSPMGITDLFCGTIGIAIICLIISKLKTKKLIPLVNAVIGGAVIGTMLHFMLDMPLIMAVLSVAAGNFISAAFGVLIFTIIERNPCLIKLIRRL